MDMQPRSEWQATTSLLEWGVVLQPLAGYKESGDQYLVQPFATGVLAAAIDGLGHGDKAAHAALAAVAVLARYAHEPIEVLMRRCHDALVGSRGVVMSLASFNAAMPVMSWLGVGNVQGLLLRANGGVTPVVHQALLLRGGTVGYRLPALRAVEVTLRPGDTIVFASDGVRSGFVKALDLRTSPQALAERVYADYARGTDDALVLVGRYRGSGGGGL